MAKKKAVDKSKIQAIERAIENLFGEGTSEKHRRNAYSLRDAFDLSFVSDPRRFEESRKRSYQKAREAQREGLIGFGEIARMIQEIDPSNDLDPFSIWKDLF